MQSKTQIKVPANNQSIAQRGMVFGVAVNDSPYLSEITIEGKRHLCPAQRAWRDMLRRCFDKSYQDKYPTYAGCQPCGDWLYFSNFMKWWDKNYSYGYHLDKDLIGNGKEYSPETCLYIPPWLNSFLSDCGNINKDKKIGAFKRDSGRYRSICSNTILGGLNSLGTFDTEEEAFNAWKVMKLDIAIKLKPKMDEIDPRIYPRVVEIIERHK